MAVRDAFDRGSDVPAELVGDVTRVIFPALLAGERLPVAEVADRADQTVATVERVLAELVRSGRGDLRDGVVVGVAGVSLETTPHRMRLDDGVELHTWCAWDLIAIPASLGRTATITTPCGRCGRRLELRIVDGEPPPDRPERGWLTRLGPRASHLQRDFCAHNHLFCSAAHARRWRWSRKGRGVRGRLHDLGGLADAGRGDWSDLVD